MTRKNFFLLLAAMVAAILIFWARTTMAPEPVLVDNTNSELVEEIKYSNKTMEGLTASIDAKVDSVLTLVSPPPADTTVATAPATPAAPTATATATTPAVAAAMPKPKKQNG